MQLVDNLAKIVDLWSHFGDRWILKGVPKFTFFERNKKWKIKMGTSNKRVWKTLILDWFLMPTWEAWKGKEDVFSFYLLQDVSFLRIVK